MGMTEYLTPAEVEEWLHIPQKTLSRWRMSGDGPKFVKAGKRVLYAVDALESWLREREVSNTGEAISLRL